MATFKSVRVALELIIGSWASNCGACTFWFPLAMGTKMVDWAFVCGLLVAELGLVLPATLNHVLQLGTSYRYVGEQSRTVAIREVCDASVYVLKAGHAVAAMVVAGPLLQGIKSPSEQPGLVLGFTIDGFMGIQ